MTSANDSAQPSLTKQFIPKYITSVTRKSHGISTPTTCTIASYPSRTSKYCQPGILCNNQTATSSKSRRPLSLGVEAYRKPCSQILPSSVTGALLDHPVARCQPGQQGIARTRSRIGWARMASKGLSRFMRIHLPLMMGLGELDRRYLFILRRRGGDARAGSFCL